MTIEPLVMHAVELLSLSQQTRLFLHNIHRTLRDMYLKVPYERVDQYLIIVLYYIYDISMSDLFMFLLFSENW